MRKRIALEYADHLAVRPRRGGAAGNPEELAGELRRSLLPMTPVALPATRSRRSRSPRWLSSPVS